jgi:hypothetical protein
MPSHAQQDEELIHKRLVELADSYSGYIASDKTLWTPMWLQVEAFVNATVVAARNQTLAEVREQIKEAVPEKLYHMEGSGTLYGGGRPMESKSWKVSNTPHELGFNEAIDTFATSLKAKGLL